MFRNSVFNLKNNVRKQDKRTWNNSVPNYADIVIPIRPRLFMPESQSVEKLMLHCCYFVTALSDGEFLLPNAPISHWRPAAYRRVYRRGRGFYIDAGGGPKAKSLMPNALRYPPRSFTYVWTPCISLRTSVRYEKPSRPDDLWGTWAVTPNV